MVALLKATSVPDRKHSASWPSTTPTSSPWSSTAPTTSVPSSPATRTGCGRGSTCSPPTSPGSRDPDDKALLAGLIAVNARHMLLFRERAAANGTDPDAYTCPDEGEAIYDRIPGLSGAGELVGYALGSLDHFAELLTVYRGAADGDDAEAIDTRPRRRRPRAGGAARPRRRRRRGLAAEAHELYRVRELAEVPRYAHAV